MSRRSGGKDDSFVTVIPLTKAKYRGTYNPPSQLSPEWSRFAAHHDAVAARQRRRDKSHRLGSPDHVDMVMATWTRDIPCSVCNEPWKAGVWATVGVDLLLYPTCGSNACNKQIRDDAIAENPGIN